MSLAKNLKVAREALDISQKALAKQIGMEQQTYHAIESGKTKQPRKLDKIAEALGTTAEALQYGHFKLGERPGTYNVTGVPAHRLHPWPLASWVSAGLRAEAIEPYENGDAPTIEFETEPGQRDIALQVRGDSMLRPDGSGFPDGCYIAVRPTRKPKSGDFVVVRFANTDEATFKQFMLDGPIKVLKPLNPAYSTMVLAPDAVIVGTVVEKRMVEKF